MGNFPNGRQPVWLGARVLPVEEYATLPFCDVTIEFADIDAGIERPDGDLRFAPLVLQLIDDGDTP